MTIMVMPLDFSKLVMDFTIIISIVCYVSICFGAIIPLEESTMLTNISCPGTCLRLCSYQANLVIWLCATHTLEFVYVQNQVNARRLVTNVTKWVSIYIKNNYLLEMVFYYSIWKKSWRMQPFFLILSMLWCIYMNSLIFFASTLVVCFQFWCHC